MLEVGRENFVSRPAPISGLCP